MSKTKLTLSAAFASAVLAASAGFKPMASEPWVSSKVDAATNATYAAATAYADAKVSGSTNAYTRAETDARLAEKPDATNVYTKAEADARIVELAPAPGDYANVSNRAANAIQSAPGVTVSTNSVAVSHSNGTFSASAELAVADGAEAAALILAASRGTNFMARMSVVPGAFEITADMDGEHKEVTVGLPERSGTLALSDDIPEQTVGEARVLPKYAHYAEFDDTYEVDAKEFYDKYDNVNFAFASGRNGRGGCTAVRIAQGVVRHYDWNLDEGVEFVGRVSPKGARHGSVFVSQIPADTTDIDEAFVSSGKWSKYYRIIPGRAVDGINDAGLVCEVNVIPSSSSDPVKGGERTLSGMGVVRYVLDNYASAGEAANYVAEHYYVPAAYRAKHMAFHWMISTKDETWIVEDGHALRIDPGVTAVKMTNFRILGSNGFDPVNNALFNESGLASYDPYGNGVERFRIINEYGQFGSLDELASFMAQKIAWTATYTDNIQHRSSEYATPDDGTGTPRSFMDSWCTDRAKVVVESVWPAKTKEEHRAEGIWWQTCHASVYDYEAKTLKVCFQEDFNNRYVFACPQTGGVGEARVAEIAHDIVTPVAQDLSRQVGERRTKTDLAVYEQVTVHSYPLDGATSVSGIGDLDDFVRFVRAKGFAPYYVEATSGWAMDPFSYNGTELTASDVWPSDMGERYPDTVYARMKDAAETVTATLVYKRVDETQVTPTGDTLAKSGDVAAKRDLADMNVYGDAVEVLTTGVKELSHYDFGCTDDEMKAELAANGVVPSNVDLDVGTFDTPSPATLFGVLVSRTSSEVDTSAMTAKATYFASDWSHMVSVTWGLSVVTNHGAVVGRLATEGGVVAVARAEATSVFAEAVVTNSVIDEKRNKTDIHLYAHSYDGYPVPEIASASNVDASDFLAFLKGEKFTVCKVGGEWKLVRETSTTVPVTSFTYDGEEFTVEALTVVPTDDEDHPDFYVSIHNMAWVRSSVAKFYFKVNSTFPVQGDRLAKLSEVGTGGIGTNAVKDIIRTFEYPVDYGKENIGLPHWLFIVGDGTRGLALTNSLSWNPELPGWTGKVVYGSEYEARVILASSGPDGASYMVQLNQTGSADPEGRSLVLENVAKMPWDNDLFRDFGPESVTVRKHGESDFRTHVIVKAVFDTISRASDDEALSGRIDDATAVMADYIQKAGLRYRTKGDDRTYRTITCVVTLSSHESASNVDGDAFFAYLKDNGIVPRYADGKWTSDPVTFDGKEFTVLWSETRERVPNPYVHYGTADMSAGVNINATAEFLDEPQYVPDGDRFAKLSEIGSGGGSSNAYERVSGIVITNNAELGQSYVLAGTDLMSDGGAQGTCVVLSADSDGSGSLILGENGAGGSKSLHVRMDAGTPTLMYIGDAGTSRYGIRTDKFSGVRYFATEESAGEIATNVVSGFVFPYDKNVAYGGISTFTADLMGMKLSIPREGNDDAWYGNGDVGDVVKAFFRLSIDRSGDWPSVTVDNAGLEGLESMGMQVVTHFDEAWTNGLSHTYTNGFVLVMGAEEQVLPVTLSMSFDRYTKDSETVKINNRLREVSDSVYDRRGLTDLFLYYETDTWDPFKMSGSAPDYAQAAFDAAGRPQPEWNGEWTFTATLTADGHTLVPQSVTEGRGDEGAEEIKVMFLDSPSGDKPEIMFSRAFHRQGSRVPGDRLAKLSDVGQGGGGTDGQAVTNIVKDVISNFTYVAGSDWDTRTDCTVAYYDVVLDMGTAHKPTLRALPDPDSQSGRGWKGSFSEPELSMTVGVMWSNDGTNVFFKVQEWNLSTMGIDITCDELPRWIGDPSRSFSDVFYYVHPTTGDRTYITVSFNAHNGLASEKFVTDTVMKYASGGGSISGQAVTNIVRTFRRNDSNLDDSSVSRAGIYKWFLNTVPASGPKAELKFNSTSGRWEGVLFLPTSLGGGTSLCYVDNRYYGGRWEFRGVAYVGGEEVVIDWFSGTEREITYGPLKVRLWTEPESPLVTDLGLEERLDTYRRNDLEPVAPQTKSPCGVYAWDVSATGLGLETVPWRGDLSKNGWYAAGKVGSTPYEIDIAPNMRKGEEPEFDFAVRLDGVEMVKTNFTGFSFTMQHPQFQTVKVEPTTEKSRFVTESGAMIIARDAAHDAVRAVPDEIAGFVKTDALDTSAPGERQDNNGVYMWTCTASVMGGDYPLECVWQGNAASGARNTWYGEEDLGQTAISVSIRSEAHMPDLKFTYYATVTCLGESKEFVFDSLDYTTNNVAFGPMTFDSMSISADRESKLVSLNAAKVAAADIAAGMAAPLATRVMEDETAYLLKTNFASAAKDRLSLEMNQSIGLVSGKSITVLGGVLSAAIDPTSNMRHVSLMPTGDNGQIKSTVAGGAGYMYDLPAKSGTLATTDDIPASGSSSYNGLKFTALATNSTVAMVAGSSTNTPALSLRYSTDDGKTWSAFTVGETTVTLANVGDSVCLECTLGGVNVTGGESENGDDSNKFVLTGRVAASGNIHSLVSKAGEWEALTSLGGSPHTFNGLFVGCAALVSAPDLPAVEIAEGAYQRMFKDCTALVKAPDLPAENAYAKSYKELFWGCTALAVPPVISATDFYQRSCYGMFKDCASLVYAPALPCTSLGRECYRDMFVRCRSLVAAPALPATVLVEHCYQDMFWDCTGLRVAPAIHIESCDVECCAGMFHGCTGLVEKPVIAIDDPGAVPEDAFDGTFDGCTALGSGSDYEAVSAGSAAALSVGNRTVYEVTASEGTLTLTLPETVSGRSCDVLVRVDCSAQTLPVSVLLKSASGESVTAETIAAGALFVPAGEIAYYTFTWTGSRWLAVRQLVVQ